MDQSMPVCAYTTGGPPSHTVACHQLSLSLSVSLSLSLSLSLGSTLAVSDHIPQIFSLGLEIPPSHQGRLKPRLFLG